MHDTSAQWSTQCISVVYIILFQPAPIIIFGCKNIEEASMDSQMAKPQPVIIMEETHENLRKDFRPNSGLLRTIVLQFIS